MNELKIANHYIPDADAIVFNGDTLDFINEIPRNSVKLIVTSPPYNMGKSYETNLDFDSYILEQEKVISECISLLTDDGSICWQVGNYVRDSEVILLEIPGLPFSFDLV
jgi:adenine-specific DNA-methyltransferase